MNIILEIFAIIFLTCVAAAGISMAVAVVTFFVTETQKMWRWNK